MTAASPSRERAASSSAVRLGALSLALSGILFLLYPALRPFSNEASFQGALAFASPSWVLAHMLAAVAFILLALSLLGLRIALQKTAGERLADVSLVVTWIGAGLTLLYYGAETFALHALGQQAVTQHSTALLHPWLQDELQRVLDQLDQEPLPVRVPLPEDHPLLLTWRHWWWSYERPKPAPPLRLILVWDNLKGHLSYSMVRWLLQHGILPLYTPLSGSWLNMAESLQRLLVRRALSGQHPQSAEDRKSTRLNSSHRTRSYAVF